MAAGLTVGSVPPSGWGDLRPDMLPIDRLDPAPGGGLDRDETCAVRDLPIHRSQAIPMGKQKLDYLVEVTSQGR